MRGRNPCVAFFRLLVVLFELTNMSSFTSENLEAIRTAINAINADGIASVTIGGQTVTAKSLDELWRSLDRMAAELGVNTTATTSSGGMFFIKTIPPGAG